MSEKPNEQEAVRTTIVGGRPPGSGRCNVLIPRGIEVLVKKAAVDPEFREVLLAKRGAAAEDIQLNLDPTEAAMLDAIPREQLAQIIDQTMVPMEQRRVFLGRFAAGMLAVLGASMAGCEPAAVSLGARPDQPATNLPPPTPGVQTNVALSQPATNQPTMSRGISPDRP
jgi:hypothetical protein